MNAAAAATSRPRHAAHRPRTPKRHHRSSRMSASAIVSAAITVRETPSPSSADRSFVRNREQMALSSDEAMAYLWYRGM